LGPLGGRRFAFVHVDVYASTLDCCRFFHPRVMRGGAILFDDDGFPPFKDAEKRAVDEFFADRPESPLSLPTGQCLVLKV